MAFSLTDQLAKVEHDMLKAGYPASDVYLALHNECKKNSDQQRSHQYFLLYKQHRDIEEQTKAKEEQQLSYNAASVVKHFPPATAAQNAIKFVETQPNYYACVENHKQMTDHMLAQGIAPTVEGFRKAYYTLRALGVLKTHPNHQPEGYYGKGLGGLLGGAASDATQAIGGKPFLHHDTALAQQQAQAHMLAQMAQEEKIKRDIIRAAMEIDTWVNKDSLKEKIKSAVVTEHVGRKFREDI